VVDPDLGQPGDDPLGRPTNSAAVHPRGPGHLAPAQSRGAEGQGLVEETMDLLFVTIINESLEGGPVAFIRVHRQPGTHPREEFVVHSTGIN
jgi:hypothetical protein